MRASSATGRGTARVPRRPAKVIRLPNPRRTQRRRTIGISGALVAMICAGAISAQVYWSAPHPANPASPAPIGPQESALLHMTNEVRARFGLPALAFSRTLMAAARFHSADMAARGYFGHDGPSGDSPADRVRRFGLDYQEVAENIFADGRTMDLALPSRVLAAWMANPERRGNLLNASFQATAVAIARAPDGSWYVTQDFIR